MSDYKELRTEQQVAMVQNALLQLEQKMFEAQMNITICKALGPKHIQSLTVHHNHLEEATIGLAALRQQYADLLAKDVTRESP